ncbi:SMI1/KNR4 family protein [Mucilaginibacter dorajii]|uniref:Knr4/Smi1-like domain-containing protein n=1 Tax=Mucilaginibacter dorajii TaxID=692994 RepID=A0ABP7P3X6_9SPHI|nr:SMI1/KNR4 family protein [Mucilaginibacter dorajii]MCS3734388.1 hypothetical protein [Mucilaginibacter dorajii]
MDNWIQEVISKWQSEGVKLNPPATISEVDAVESFLSFKFPNDFKEFYSQANGFNGLDWQEHMFTFWPLEMIVEEYKTNGNKNFVGFSDFLLASHFIGFNKNTPGIFKSYSEDDNGKHIADSFEEVISMINSSNDNIY